MSRRAAQHHAMKMRFATRGVRGGCVLPECGAVEALTAPSGVFSALLSTVELGYEESLFSPIQKKPSLLAIAIPWPIQLCVNSVKKKNVGIDGAHRTALNRLANRDLSTITKKLRGWRVRSKISCCVLWPSGWAFQPVSTPVRAWLPVPPR